MEEKKINNAAYAEHRSYVPLGFAPLVPSLCKGPEPGSLIRLRAVIGVPVNPRTYRAEQLMVEILDDSARLCGDQTYRQMGLQETIKVRKGGYVEERIGQILHSPSLTHRPLPIGWVIQGSH